MRIITETPRLIIREFTPGEQEVYLKHFDDEEVCRYIPKRTREERVKIFHAALENYKLNTRLGIWGFFNKAGGDCIGSSLLRVFDDDPTRVELGYSMERGYWGRGIGTEMAVAMVQYAFSDPTVTEIIGITTLENTGSRRVLEKAGLIKQPNIIRDGDEMAYFKLGRKI